MKHSEFLGLIADRLVLHGDSPDAAFVVKLREIASSLGPGESCAKYRVEHRVGPDDEIGLFCGDSCWVVVDGETGDPIGWDGGQPEDQLLVRDWDWVAPALNAAFDAGRRAVLGLAK